MHGREEREVGVTEVESQLPVPTNAGKSKRGHVATYQRKRRSVGRVGGIASFPIHPRQCLSTVVKNLRLEPRALGVMDSRLWDHALPISRYE